MLYFLRHGSTRLNEGDPADPIDYYRGWTNEPLSEFGHRTGDEAARWIAKNLDIHQIVSSDLQRASDTANKVADLTGAPVRHDARARTWNVGSFEGAEITPATHAYIHYLQHVEPDTEPHGGERYNDFILRYSGLLPELLQQSENQNTLLVAHHRNALSLYPLLYGLPAPNDGPPAPSGVMEVAPEGMTELFKPSEKGVKDTTGEGGS
jgi:glucosyl-3-phosphoglycerate phosphatase